jgi:hypothetical protein
MALSVTGPVLVLGEGREEEKLFRALIRHLGRKDVQVENYQGKTNLRKFLQALAASTGFSQIARLIVTRDADDDETDALRSVLDALSAARLPTPRRCFEVAVGSPDVIVGILPGGGQPGALEDICIAALAADPTMVCVDAFLQCTEDRAGAKARQPRIAAKAKVQAWLAARERPGLRLGDAALAGHLPFDHEAFAPLRQVFGI